MNNNRPTKKNEIKNTKTSVVCSIAVLIISSAMLSAVSLNFAFGINDWIIYFGYFQHPMIFLLNWIPVLLLQILLFSIFNRHWLAFLLNSLLTMLPAIGNFYKLKFRNDPFTFSDITSIRAGLAVAGEYELQLNTRIIVSVAAVLLITLTLVFFIRSRMPGKFRLLLSLTVLLSVWPLWTYVYSSNTLYRELALQNRVPTTLDSRQSYIDTGFPYPFIHSIKTSAGSPPEGYNEQATTALLFSHQDAAIPADRRVNILAIQLESFCDLDAMGISGISPDVYQPLRNLQEECLYGTMIANVIGGGTIYTERVILAGTTKMMEYTKPAWSYVRYLKGQGYTCIGSHPNVASFYSRSTVMGHLGFDSFLFADYFQPITNGKWRCDSTYLPEIFHIFRESVQEDTPVFSFNITLQGHGPYHDDHYDTDDRYWSGSNVSESTEYIMNNYLSLIAETQRVLIQEIDSLRSMDEPVVVLMYGDHKPWLGDNVYDELGISFNLATQKGLEDYLGTPYLLWANDAAKEICPNSFSGTAPLISPGYLMNVLFESLDWEGPAYMQCVNDVRRHLPVIYKNGGYIENGTYTRSLSPDGEALLLQFESLQYYLRYRV